MALAFYPLVAWLAYAARGRGQGLVRRPAPRAAPRRTAARGTAVPPGDRQQRRFGAAWSKSERAVIVVHVRTRGLFREGCARLGCIGTVTGHERRGFTRRCRLEWIF